MDFDLNDEQMALEQTLATIASRRAGVDRLRELLAQEAYDTQLHAELADGGFLDLVEHEGGGPLAALLVVEAMAGAVANVAVGTHALVLPAIGMADLDGPIVLIDQANPGPVRFAAHAKTAILLDGSRAKRLNLDGRVAGTPTAYCYPFGRLAPGAEAFAEPLDVDVDALRRWWRVALAAETAAVLSAATLLTRDYVCDRHQFGRPLGSFQAVQHYLARAIVHVESVRWLARWAAGSGCGEEDAAVAAAAACLAAVEVPKGLHQVTGAMGFTHEHDLHLYTGRALSLRVEFGGIDAHTEAVTAARWG